MVNPVQVEGAWHQWTTGDRCRKAREAAGLTQAELAESIGTSRNTVVNYETDAVSQNLHTLIAWAVATETASDWLLGKPKA
jgi:transcriptional regulator with XRE-family HTH domain